VSAFPQKWTDEQVLAVLRAANADIAQVAADMGMSERQARSYRLSASVRGMRLRAEHGLGRLVRFHQSADMRRVHPRHSSRKERELIARIQRGDA
jgi:hypothetical protein